MIKRKTKEITNKQISQILEEIAELLEIEGVKFKPKAYKIAAKTIENLEKKLTEIYQKEGKVGLQKIKGIGKSIAQKIEEILKTGKSKYLEELKEKNRIRIIVTHYFETKGVSLEQLKKDAKKKKNNLFKVYKASKTTVRISWIFGKSKRSNNESSRVGKVKKFRLCY
jgi:DNA polymerase/3'-5' exonuclease PolX